MPEEADDVEQPVCVIAMDGSVVVTECLLEAFVPHAVELAEPFADEAVEGRIRPFLGATLNNHVA